MPPNLYLDPEMVKAKITNVNMKPELKEGYPFLFVSNLDMRGGYQSSCNQLMKQAHVIRDGYKDSPKVYEYQSMYTREESAQSEQERKRIFLSTVDNIKQRTTKFMANVASHKKFKSSNSVVSLGIFENRERQLELFVHHPTDFETARRIDNLLRITIVAPYDLPESLDFDGLVWAMQKQRCNPLNVGFFLIESSRQFVTAEQATIDHKIQMLRLTTIMCKRNLFLARQMVNFLQEHVTNAILFPTIVECLRDLIWEADSVFFNNQTLSIIDNMNEVIACSNLDELVNDLREDIEDTDTLNEEIEAELKEYDFIHLLDYYPISIDFKLKELLQRMADLDQPEEQFSPLLEWSVRQRSSMGCTLAAKIIKKWNVECTREALIEFILESQPIEEGKKEGQRFLRIICRLFSSLSYEGLITYDHIINRLITLGYQSFDQLPKETDDYNLGMLIKNLPIVGDPRGYRNRRSFLYGYNSDLVDEEVEENKIFTRIIGLLNRLFCTNFDEWSIPLNEGNTNELKMIINSMEKSQSHFSIHRLVERTGNVLLGSIRDIGLLHNRIVVNKSVSVPRLAAIQVTVQLMNLSVDSTLIARFLYSCLPYLHDVMMISPCLSIFCSSFILTLLSRSFQSHLSFAVSGLWPMIKKSVTEMISYMCPSHWQTKLLANIVNTCVPPTTVCALKHVRLFKDESEEESWMINLINRVISGDINQIFMPALASKLGDIVAQDRSAAKRIKQYILKKLMELSHGSSSSSHLSSLSSLIVHLSSKDVIDIHSLIHSLLHLISNDDTRLAISSLSILREMFIGRSGSREEEQLMIEMRVGSMISDILRTLITVGEEGNKEVQQMCHEFIDRLVKQQWSKRSIRISMNELDGCDINPFKWRSINRSVTSVRLDYKWRETNDQNSNKVEQGPLFTSICTFSLDPLLRDVMLLIIQERSKDKESSVCTSYAERLADTVLYLMTTNKKDQSYAAFIFITRLKRMMKESQWSTRLSVVFNQMSSIIVQRFAVFFRGRNRSPMTYLLILPRILNEIYDGINEQSRNELKNGLYSYFDRRKIGSGYKQPSLDGVTLSTALSCVSILIEKNELCSSLIIPLYELIGSGMIHPTRNGIIFDRTKRILSDLISIDKKGNQSIMNIYERSSLEGYEKNILNIVKSSSRLCVVPPSLSYLIPSRLYDIHHRYERITKKGNQFFECTHAYKCPSNAPLTTRIQSLSDWRVRLQATVLSTVPIEWRESRWKGTNAVSSMPAYDRNNTEERLKSLCEIEMCEETINKNGKGEFDMVIKEEIEEDNDEEEEEMDDLEEEEYEYEEVYETEEDEEIIHNDDTMNDYSFSKCT